MTRKNVTPMPIISLLAVAAYSNAAIADEAPLPMRQAEPLVYATPLTNTVILEFLLYDRKTWCRLYLKKDVWEAAKADGGKLPEGADIGQLQCERR